MGIYLIKDGHVGSHTLAKFSEEEIRNAERYIVSIDGFFDETGKLDFRNPNGDYIALTRDQVQVYNTEGNVKEAIVKRLIEIIRPKYFYTDMPVKEAGKRRPISELF